jgi:hypothetical protein
MQPQPRLWLDEPHGNINWAIRPRADDAENLAYVVANFAGRNYYDIIPVIRSSWAVGLEDAIDIYHTLVEPQLREVTLQSSNVDVDSFYGDVNQDLEVGPMIGGQLLSGEIGGGLLGAGEEIASYETLGLPVLAGATVLALVKQAAVLWGIRGVALWNRIPASWKTALATIGILASTIDIDWPFVGDGSITDFGGKGGNSKLERASGNLDGNFDTIVAKWEANGVWFYKLLDGRMAVQRLDGTWKFWRPKKPIVLYSDGASDLKTLLRADKALDRQSKKLRKMLDRRAPRPRRSRQQPAIQPGPQIISLPSGG